MTISKLIWTFNCEYRNITQDNRFAGSTTPKGAILMHKKWYKMKRGFVADPKLAVAARRAGLTLAECLALYICLLDIASASNPPGHIGSPDTEEISVLIDIDISKIDAGISSLREKKLISPDNKINWWTERPSSSTLRVRRMRERRKAEQPSAQKPLLQQDTPQAVASRRQRLMADYKNPSSAQRENPRT